MNILGHLGVALISKELAHVPDHPLDSGLLLTSAFYPDVVDKFVGYGLKLMPNGRNVSHTIFSLVITTLLVYVCFGRRGGYAWLVGYTSHLLADSDRFVPWWYPFKAYRFPRGKGIQFNPDELWEEGSFLVFALALFALMRAGKFYD